MKTPQQQLFQESIRRFALELKKSAHGEKTAMKEAFAQKHGISYGTLARKLNAVGYGSKTKRCDAGKTGVDKEILVKASAMIEAGMRKNGKATMHVPLITAILKNNGFKIPVSNSTFASLLRKHRLHQKAICSPSGAITMKTDYPNQVHQVDPSLCLLYYTPSGMQKVICDTEANNNKPEWVVKVGDLKCWRYVLTDHFSGSIIVKYYQAKGESQENLYDFLLYAWSKLEGRTFHGLPDVLVWDRGSANTAQSIKNALESLDVQQRAHRPKNARAKGQVEKSNDIVETHFESGLKHEPVSSVDELNAAVEYWYNCWNSNTYPNFDSRLKRDGHEVGQVRYELWQRIQEKQLRLLPDIDVCRYLLVKDPETRKVNTRMEITFRHPVSKKSETYSVAELEMAYVGETVLVRPLVMEGIAKVFVSIEDFEGAEHSIVCEPVGFDAISGFRLDAASFVDDEYKSLPDSVADKNRKAADKAAYGGTQEEIKKAKDKNVAPFGGLVTHSHLKDVEQPNYMPKRGSDIDVPNRFQEKPEQILQGSELLIALKKQYGLTLEPMQRELLTSWYPEGVPESELPSLVAQLQDDNNNDKSSGLTLVK